jgi:hypothetical protein
VTCVYIMIDANGIRQPCMVLIHEDNLYCIMHQNKIDDIDQFYAELIDRMGDGY